MTGESVRQAVDRSRKRDRDAPSHVVSWPLRLSPGQGRRLDAKFLDATRVFNAALAEAMKRSRHVKADPGFAKAREMPKGRKIGGKWDQAHKDRAAAFTTVETAHGFSKGEVGKYATRLRQAHIRAHLGAHEVQVLAVQAWRAVSDWHYASKGKPRFKPASDKNSRGLHSLSGKEKDSTIRPYILDGVVAGLRIGDPRRGGMVLFFRLVRGGDSHRARADQDNWDRLQEAVTEGLLFAKIVRKRRKGRWDYIAQFTVDGPAPTRHSRATSGRASLDMGPAHMGVAILDEDTNTWEGSRVPVAPGVEDLDKELRCLQRRLDRQHRVNSPDCFRDDGTHKHSRCTWVKSKRAQATADRIAEVHRRLAEHRKTVHGAAVNFLLSRASDIRIEDLSYKGWQKTYPHMTRRYGAGTLVSTLRSKAASAGSELLEFQTWRTALSQTCVCGNRRKKTLTERTHRCVRCGVVEQRDVLSAYLGMFVERELNQATGEVADRLDLHAAQEAYPSKSGEVVGMVGQEAVPGRGPVVRHKSRGRSVPSRHSQARINARRKASSSTSTGDPTEGLDSKLDQTLPTAPTVETALAA